MKRFRLVNLMLSLGVLVMLVGCNGKKELEIKVVATSDVHGNFYPYDFINDAPATGSLARVQTYLIEQRKQYGKRLVYVDNGDIMQGQPTAYYYNTVAVADVHLADQMLNYMGCRIGTLGNHDIETGGPTYQRYVLNADYPVLGANILFQDTDQPFIPPYNVVDVDGVKVAFLGMLTPAIPSWLPRELWRELQFVDMKSSAERWIPYIREHENPDVVIGVFHSGYDGGIVEENYCENATAQVAREVPGFDAVIFGHDHRLCCDTIVNVEGKQIPIVNPASSANHVATLTIKVGKKVKSAEGTNPYEVLEIKPELVSMENVEPDPKFMETFAPQMKLVKDYVSKRIGHFTADLDSRESYFGPSAFMDFVHKMQLDITSADISIAAPLSFKAMIGAGDVYVRDMFNLYKYENMLYTMLLTGQEVKDHLEMSYDQWTNQMTSSEGHLLLLDESRNDGIGGDKNGGDSRHPRLKNIFYNFDSAAGIIYEVDVTKPAGQRVHIISMADGTSFDLSKEYRVAVNSYRGNGGGELLTKGAGIPREELSRRIDYSTSADLRFYMLNYIAIRDTVTPASLNQWKFVPENWTKPAAERDYKLLFD